MTVARHLENLKYRGHSLMPGVISRDEAADLCKRLDSLYDEQRREFGEQRLRELNEFEVHRGLMAADSIFATLVVHPMILEVVDAVVGPTAILNLQNASAASPGAIHFQSRLHRDFARDFVASKPLALNAFWCITDFTADAGATWLVPGTHRHGELPSEEFAEQNAVQIEAPAGSVILWDGLLLHKAGQNRTDRVRYGINHMYTRPFIKQQMDYPVFLRGKYEVESRLGQLLGFWTIPPKSVTEFRVDPDKRTYRRNQG